MSYNDLSNSKIINGFPADQDLLSKIFENQSFLKTEIDNDEDLEMLDRNLVPVNDNEVLVGTSSKRIKEITAIDIKTSNLEVSPGSQSSLPFKFQGEETGFFKQNPGEIRFKTQAVVPLLLAGSGATLRAGNTTSLKLENTQPGQESTWSLGCDAAGFKIGSIQNSFLPVLEIGANGVSSPSFQLRSDGSPSLPSLSFSSSLTTGLFRDSVLSSLGLAVEGVELLSVSSLKTTIESSQLFIQKGDLSSPGLIFSGAGDTGLGSSSDNDVKIFSDSEILLTIGGAGKADVHVEKTLGISSLDSVGPLVDEEIDVAGNSKVFMSTIDGDISVASFVNPSEGQILYIVKGNTENTLTIKHDFASATVPIMLKGNSDYVIGAGYGGLVLSYDLGIWREVSRS